MPALKRLPATRIVAKAAALDAAQWPEDRLVFRTAADELLISPPLDSLENAQAMLDDPHAIIIDDHSFAGIWLERDEAMHYLAHACEWELPAIDKRPTYAQGSIAGLATKIWFEEDRILLVVPAPYAEELKERLA